MSSSDQEKFAISRRAQKSGGPCPLCQWKDGDGVKVCFYSHELGEVSHENSEAAVEASMTPSQRSLYQSYNSMHDNFEHMHDHTNCVMGSDEYGHDTGWKVPHTCGGAVQQRRNDTTGQFYWYCPGCGVTDEGNGLAVFSREMLWSHKHPAIDHSLCKQDGTYWKLPHSCGGFGTFAAAYEIACTRCSERVRLWEHGVDYDIG
jgi:hypothetical protein